VANDNSRQLPACLAIISRDGLAAADPPLDQSAIA